MRNGDLIEIDLNTTTLTLHVDDAELEKRKAAVKKPDRPLKGMLAAYRAAVSGAEQGTLWMYNAQS